MSLRAGVPAAVRPSEAPIATGAAASVVAGVAVAARSALALAPRVKELLEQECGRQLVHVSLG